MKKLPDISILRQHLSYDPRTGVFTWVESGKTAGSIYKFGYRYICIFGSRYRAARLAWKFFYGFDPLGFVDHINGIRSDDRIENLRICNNSQNCRNKKISSSNSSGYKGVTKQNGRWRAQIEVDGKHVSLGMFDDPIEAHKAYVMAAEMYFGEFARFK